MCMSSSPPAMPKPLPPPPPPPPPPEVAKQATPQVKAAKRETDTRQRNLQGAKSTQLTGPRGIMAPVDTATTGLLSK
jgi:hypothetical protein